MPKKVYIRTFGCQMNDRDTELIYGLLAKEGYAKAACLEDADIVIFNTCAVRKHAEDRVWGQAGALKKLVVPPSFASAKQSRGDARPMKKIIGLAGCMAQSHKEKIFKKLPHVDFVCGPANIYDIPDLIKKVQDKRSHIAALNRTQRPDIEQPAVRKSAISAYVSISEGCDNFCSYCIVPYARGRLKNRSKKLILDEVKKIAGLGYKEVILLGQNVNSYKSDQSLAVLGTARRRTPSESKGAVKGSSGQENGFVKLLEEVNKIDGIERIRFITSHPKDASGDLFRAMRDLDKVCEHLHLPLQSGSDKILKKMRRNYTQKKYLKLVEDFRKIVPNSSLTTDIIVGFPGESEEDFNDTYKMIQRIKFNSAFIFKYSPRPPAKSCEYKDDAPKNVKEQRHQILLTLQKEISDSYH